MAFTAAGTFFGWSAVRRRGPRSDDALDAAVGQHQLAQCGTCGHLQSEVASNRCAKCGASIRLGDAHIEVTGQDAREVQRVASRLLKRAQKHNGSTKK